MNHMCYVRVRWTCSFLKPFNENTEGCRSKLPTILRRFEALGEFSPLQIIHIILIKSGLR
jgi:hypothetical protein